MNLLWHSNGPWTLSGYGQQSALTLPRIKALGHNVACSCFFGLEGAAIDWNGIPCYPTDRTRFGLEMLGEYAAHHAGGDRTNCLVLTLMDVWPLMPGLPNYGGLRWACWTPIDHDPVPPMVTEFLQKVDARVIAMTRFGQDRLAAEGFDPSYVPHAVDTSVFKPDAETAAVNRRRLGIPDGAFVVGMVAANQGLPSRKGFPQLFEAFAEFRRRHDDAMLYLHTDATGRLGGMDLNHLARLCGIPAESTRITEYAKIHIGLPPDVVASIYAMFDVLAIPSLGEGFGIPLIEAQACGVPVITTNWTAMPELVGPGWLVEGDRFYDGSQRSFYKVPSIAGIVEALEQAYEARGDAELRGLAREFAVGYDVDTVFEAYWKPVLAELERPREVPPLRLAA